MDRTPYHDRRHARGFGRGRAMFVIGLVAGVLATLIIGQLSFTAKDRQLEFVRAVHDLARDTYVDDVDSQVLVDDALRGMVEGLDRYSRYYGPAQIARLDRETTGEFRGIGVVFRPPVRDGQVLFPFSGAPAERAGMRVGDRIVAIGGELVADMEPGQLQRSIQTASGEELRFLVRGLDGEERKISLQPEKIIDPTVRHVRMLDAERGAGYLAILSFSHRTPDEFDAAITQLKSKGLRSLIIDLRSNPGGILDSAITIANRFIREGTIVVTQTRDDIHVSRAIPEEARLAGIPLVLLVDEGSASASEVLAGALQDHCACVIVGEPTYGKGTVQTLTRFSDDRAIIKITTANYFTPAWRRIERDGRVEGETGLAPDVLLPLEDDVREDVYRFLGNYSPPPNVLPELLEWERTEDVDVIPDPPDDPQLAAGLGLLLGSRPGTHGEQPD